MAKKAKIPSNIYTVLIAFSFLALTASTVFLYVKAEEVGMSVGDDLFPSASAQ